MGVEVVGVHTLPALEVYSRKLTLLVCVYKVILDSCRCSLLC